MNKIKEKIMRTNFTKALKRLFIIALCAAILGGGASAFLLRTQIGEAVTYIRQEERRGDESTSREESGSWRKEDKEDKEQHDREWNDLENVITRPSAAAKAAVGITGIFCFLIGIGFWLLIAAWLYQAAVLAGMHGFLWFLLGLGGSVGAAVIFLVVRSLIREKCDTCGGYQTVNAQYCTKCGTALSAKCPECGAAGGKGDRFCRSCGKALSEE